LAVTLDGRTHLPHGPARTPGDEARARVHGLRAERDAIGVGAQTVHTDDPLLTVRHADGPSPERIVLSRHPVPASARVQPCTRWDGAIGDLLDQLGGRGIVQLMVEGGPVTVGRFAAEGVVDRWVFHVAPFVSGEPGAPTMASRRGTVVVGWRRSPRCGTNICTASTSGTARLMCTRSADGRAPPAACNASIPRDPTGSAYTPGVTTAPTTCT
jgi:diaminohydroxyphosphoribosylaminopyrimidine deaminase/5-amino-6-(5-phosphoribosylamino)uracil reductase